MANHNNCFKDKDDQIVVSKHIENQQFQKELAAQYEISIDTVHITDYVNLIAQEVPEGELRALASEHKAYEKLLFMAKTLEFLGRRDLIEQIDGFKKLH